MPGLAKSKELSASSAPFNSGIAQNAQKGRFPVAQKEVLEKAKPAAESRDSEQVKEQESQSPSKVLDSVGPLARCKMPTVLLLFVGYGIFIFIQHRRTENRAWEELKGLKAQLVEAASMRHQASQVQTKLSGMLKDVADLRQNLEQDQKQLAEWQTTIAGMDSKTAVFVKQIDSCPVEIQTSLSKLEAKITQPEGANAIPNFEKQYMPLMWKAADELRSRINNAQPEDVSDLKQKVDMLNQLLQDASSKITKVENAEYMDRQAKISELEGEIKRLGGASLTSNPPVAFTEISKKQRKAGLKDLKGVHWRKQSASTLRIKGEPLKCMQS